MKTHWKAFSVICLSLINLNLALADENFAEFHAQISASGPVRHYKSVDGIHITAQKIKGTQIQNIIPDPSARYGNSLFFVPAHYADDQGLNYFNQFLIKLGAVENNNLMKAYSIEDVADKVIAHSQRTGQKHYKALVLNGWGNSGFISFTKHYNTDGVLQGRNESTLEFIRKLNTAGISFSKIVIPSFSFARGVASNRDHAMKVLSSRLLYHPEVVAVTSPTFFGEQFIQAQEGTIVKVKAEHNQIY